MLRVICTVASLPSTVVGWEDEVSEENEKMMVFMAISEINQSYELRVLVRTYTVHVFPSQNFESRSY